MLFLSVYLASTIFATTMRADEVYEKALRDLKLMSYEEFTPFLGQLIQYCVERVISSEPLGPGPVQVTTTTGGGSGSGAAAATVSGGDRGRAGAAAATPADDDESDEDKEKDKSKKSGAGGSRRRGRTSTTAAHADANEDTADKSKNNDKVSGTIAGDAVDKESGVSATPSPSKNAGPRDPAIPNVPAVRVATRGGGGQKGNGKGGLGARCGGAGPPAVAASNRD
jgi:hypothetical protein